MIREPPHDRRGSRPAELPLYLPDRPVAPARRAVPLAERWRQLDQLAGARQPPRRGAAPGPAAAPYRAGTAQCTEITFRRAVEVPFSSSLEAMAGWWREAGRGGVLAVGHSRLSGPPRPEPSGRSYRVEARIGGGLLWPAVGADLELFPWLGTFGTQLTLCPRRTVHPGRHYFSTGHALLDAVVATLQQHGASVRR